VFLIGFRGAGKSSIAKELAGQLGWTWIDLDTVLEAKYGRSIRAIFEQEGEQGFRDKERELLEQVAVRDAHVFATGGGIVLDPVNRDRMREAGWVVWITADTATLWQRLQSDPATGERRPPLTVGGRAEIEALLRIREPLYQQCADIVVDTVNRLPAEIASTIREKLSELNKRVEG